MPAFADQGRSSQTDAILLKHFEIVAFALTRVAERGHNDDPIHDEPRGDDGLHLFQTCVPTVKENSLDLGANAVSSFVIAPFDNTISAYTSLLM